VALIVRWIFGRAPRRRGIQYAAASRFDHRCRCLLDHPLSRV